MRETTKDKVNSILQSKMSFYHQKNYLQLTLEIPKDLLRYKIFIVDRLLGRPIVLNSRYTKRDAVESEVQDVQCSEEIKQKERKHIHKFYIFCINLCIFQLCYYSWKKTHYYSFYASESASQGCNSNTLFQQNSMTEKNNILTHFLN